MHTADRSGGQIVIDGEDVMLKPEAVQDLGLALHELATNAQKYGALSSGRGSVRISLAILRVRQAEAHLGRAGRPSGEHA